MRFLICILYISCTSTCFALSWTDSLSKNDQTSDSLKELDKNRVMRNKILQILPICDNIILQATKEQIKKWNLLLNNRINDRTYNESSSNEMILTDLAREWCFDNRNKKDVAILEACLFLRRFVNEGIMPPAKLLEGVNNQLRQRVIHQQNSVGYDALVMANK
jgi:hypothetical protein